MVAMKNEKEAFPLIIKIGFKKLIDAYKERMENNEALKENKF